MRANTFGLVAGAMLLLFAVMWGHAAPAPRYKPKPEIPPVWPVGLWKMTFAGCYFRVVLADSGAYADSTQDEITGRTRKWSGNWTWCRNSRILLIHARPDYLTNQTEWQTWSMKLDSNLSGVCSGAFDTPVRFEPTKK